MILRNGLVFTEKGTFEPLDVQIAGDKIVAVAKANTLEGDEVLDVAGKYITPGFVDVHIHGAKGADFCDGKAEGIETMSEYLGSEGVTSYLGTTMAFDEPILTDLLTTATPYFHKDGYGAVLRGVNMEGPFFNMERKGAQAGKYIVTPDYDFFNRMYELTGGNIKLIDIAPELEGGLEFIEKASKQCVVSIAHTCATFEQAEAAFNAGASHVTHLFNAMPAFNHRNPGVIGAAADAANEVEIISDGIHLHPSVVRTTFKMFGEDGVCLISDAMRACGMPNGEYSLGGQAVFMTDGKATLKNGTIAGSATCLAECFRRAVGFGVPLEQALKAATINPARCAGLLDTLGTITAGKRADVLVLDETLHPTDIFIGGVKTK